MNIKPITIQDREAFNKVVSHPLQSWEWGEFREKTGIKVIRRGIYDKDELVGGFQLTIHPIPHTPYTIGYLPKGEIPTKEILEELQKIGTEEKCIFIQLEPNLQKDIKTSSDKDIKGESNEVKALNILISKYLNILPSAHPLFTRYTFVLDLTKSEEQLLKDMHPKTRYNIKVAQRHGVEVKEDNSDKAFERYWELTEETTKRQGFYAHSKRYHQLQWETFPHPEMLNEARSRFAGKKSLTSHLFTATYEGKILTTMLFFIFHDSLYYPYGASSDESRNVMHSTLAMWEAIRLGKKLGLKKFDMWGALGSNPDPKDPWIGFHTFKERFGPEHVEFVGSYDLIINPRLYQLYKLTDKLRWIYLKIKK
jgi:lipid II:glycine glycyltransferase (peptidoglycan interpeptide bridge formation enzyme)